MAGYEDGYHILSKTRVKDTGHTEVIVTTDGFTELRVTVNDEYVDTPTERTVIELAIAARNRAKNAIGPEET